MHAAHRKLCLLGLPALLSLSASGSLAEQSEELARRELDAIRLKVAAFQVVPLPARPGEVALTAEQSLTVEQLRGVALDDDPPVLGEPAAPYDKRMTDDFPPGEAPYLAKDIAPFRFRYFNCEFNYGGWHNFAMADYASTRGFNILYPYTRKIDEGAHLPKGTQWLGWSGFINWHKWLPGHGIADGRYDLLIGKDLVKLHLDEGKFARTDPPPDLKAAGDYLMIDMEHGVLPPDNLREQEWYPKQAGAAEREAFEQRYYDGYAQTYVSALQAARKQGWQNLSIYGWAPYGRTWGGLEQPEVEPGAEFAWNAFGKQIYDSVDLLNNSVYCFYWSPQNVAYTLANIDSNMELVNSMPVKKPVRPYFWTLLHGGGGGWRWWRGQPLPNEEQRAMIAMSFFTGIDGFDTWNWSGTGNHHVPLALFDKAKADAGEDYFSSGADVMLKDGFELTPEGAADAKPQTFRRYDALHVIGSDEGAGIVRFQKIVPAAKDKGMGDEYPVYALSAEELKSHVRVKSEPVAAMIEGMAMVRPFEYLLRHGEVKIDVPARAQWKQTLPIVRRVKLGDLHVLITYDPLVIHGGEPREIVLEDFDGRAGLTLRLPADEETRIFVLEEGVQAA